MLKEEFETWLADPLSNATLIIVGIYAINLSYPKDGPFCFIELPNSNIEESDKILIGLDTVIVIPKTDNQDLLDLINLEIQWANKKKEKVENRWQRKINLVQATTTNNAPSSPNTFICCFLLSSITGGDFWSTILGCLLSFIAGGGLLSTILGHLLSIIADSSLLSAVFGHFLSLNTSDGPLSIVLCRFLSLVIGGSPLFNVFNSGPLSSVFFAGSQVLFLTSTPSCARCFFYPLCYFSILFYSLCLYYLPIIQLYELEKKCLIRYS